MQLSELPVVEWYACFQGEGPQRGRPSTLLRLSGCNLACKWKREDGSEQICDTAYTVPAFTKPLVFDKIPIEELVQLLKGQMTVHHINHLIISGGEPMLYAERVKEFILQLRLEMEPIQLFIEIETNGTIAPLSGMEVDQWNVSLKLPSSGNQSEKTHIPIAIQRFAKLSFLGVVIFKFVVAQMSDFDEIKALLLKYTIPERAVWIMPEGVDRERIAKWGAAIAPEVLEEGFNFTLRDHIILWGQERYK